MFFAVRIFKDPQADHFLGEVNQIVLRIIRADSEQNDEPASDGSDRFSVDGDAGGRNTLNDGRAWRRAIRPRECSGRIRRGDLPGEDSNLDEQDQNLLCYRYTTG